MLKDRQTTARTIPRLERTETEIKSFCDRKRNVLMTRVWSAGGDPPIAQAGGSRGEVERERKEDKGMKVRQEEERRTKLLMDNHNFGCEDMRP